MAHVENDDLWRREVEGSGSNRRSRRTSLRPRRLERHAEQPRTTAARWSPQRQWRSIRREPRRRVWAVQHERHGLEERPAGIARRTQAKVSRPPRRRCGSSPSRCPASPPPPKRQIIREKVCSRQRTGQPAVILGPGPRPSLPPPQNGDIRLQAVAVHPARGQECQSGAARDRFAQSLEHPVSEWMRVKPDQIAESALSETLCAEKDTEQRASALRPSRHTSASGYRAFTIMPGLTASSLVASGARPPVS